MTLITVSDPRLATEATALTQIFPDRSQRDLAMTLLRLLANQSGPVTTVMLAERLGVSHASATRAVADLPNVSFDDDHSINGFIGLSRTTTPHRMTMTTDTEEGPATVTRHGWCAWDTMFLPRLLGCHTLVETSCPLTSAPLSFTLTKHGELEENPNPSVVLCLPMAGAFDPHLIRSTFCCEARALSDDRSASEWARLHPRAVAHTIEAGVELGALATTALTDPADAHPCPDREVQAPA